MGEIGVLLVGGNFECDREYRRLRVFSRVLHSHRKDSRGDAGREEKKLWKKVREAVRNYSEIGDSLQVEREK